MFVADKRGGRVPVTPKTIRIERYGTTARVLVDGDEFPFAVAEDGVIIGPIGTDSMPTVTLTLWAECVEVIDSAFREPKYG